MVIRKFIQVNEKTHSRNRKSGIVSCHVPSHKGSKYIDIQFSKNYKTSKGTQY